MTTRRAMIALPAILALAGCKSCATPKQPQQDAALSDVETLLPRNIEGVLTARSLSKLGAAMTELARYKAADFAAQTQGVRSARDLADTFTRQFGFDPRDPAALAALGIDGTRPAGMAIVPDGGTLVAIPVADATRFNTASARWLLNSLAAKPGTQAGTFMSPDGTVRAAVSIANGYGLVGVGAASSTALAGRPTESLADDARFRRLRGSTRGDIETYAPPHPSTHFDQNVALFGSASFTEQGISCLMRLEGDGDPKFLAALVPVASTDFTASLPTDGFLHLRYHGDPPALGRALGTMRQYREVDFTAVAGAFSPGIAATIGLSPTASANSTDPLSFVSVAGVVRLKAPAADTLKSLAAIAPRFGARATLTLGPNPRLTNKYAAGEGLTFLTRGADLAFGAPMARVQALLAKPTFVGTSVDAPPAFTATLTIAALNRELRAMPESNWGIGGTAMRETALRWIDSLSDIDRIALEASANEKIIEATLNVIRVVP